MHRRIMIVDGAMAFAAHFLEDLEVSREIDRQIWKRRPLHKRAGELATDLVRQSL